MRNVRTSSESLLPLNKRNLLKKHDHEDTNEYFVYAITLLKVLENFSGLSLCCKLFIESGPILMSIICKSVDIKFRVQPTPVHCGKFQKKMAKSDKALDRVRKQLRSVLISEKHGVAVERVERDYL